ncbi:MAG TPA: LacI family DNA-binding transcriptional regulator [Phycisphaerae bacterium]|nr:LacI family DNA-binding transcriptional regulator [Phycisphaerae bacterium]HRY70217.1 LacI family DNA-binding transcriptional regulator [Phycisphaerae bacterium]HSA27432.1 LacI family DNA-binding transcriptional regulator [Phycisphaerae bacterium]
MRKPDSKSVTSEQIASKLKLSPTTVSLVLNGRGQAHRISDRTARRVLATARRMNYRPNPIARQLAGKRSNAVGVLINTEAVVDVRIIQWMERRAADRGIRFIVGHAIGSRERVRDYLDDFRARGVDGVISVFHNHPDYAAFVQPALARFGNVVYYEKPGVLRRTQAERACYVEADFREVGRVGVRHLLERGRRRIGLVMSNLVFPYAVQRHESYRESLAAAGLDYDERLVWVLGERTAAGWMDAFTPDLAQAAVDHLVLDQKVDGIVAVNDAYAARIMAALRHRGRRVPEDVAVVGCDNLDISTLVDPPLTTIDLRVEELARAMTSLLFELLDEGTVPADRRAVVIPPQLVVRASS